jgi:hypothetical protein
VRYFITQTAEQRVRVDLFVNLGRRFIVMSINIIVYSRLFVSSLRLLLVSIFLLLLTESYYIYILLSNMSATTLFARTLSRRVLQSSLQGRIAPQLGAIRFSSYYTPGMSIQRDILSVCSL